ncbi:hypothetical protein MTR67_034630, partial [Solanum verrucosum]
FISFVVDVKSKQDLDPLLVELKKSVLKKSVEAFSQGGDGVLRYQGQLCILDVDGLREKILEEAHSSRYFIHLGPTKMYRDLWEVYWWNGMKKDIAGFLDKCPNYQQVKVEHQRPGGFLHDIPIPTWKWEERIGKVAYELVLSNELTPVHPVFHVSMLKMCIGDPTSTIPLEGLGVDESLSYEEVLVRILDRQVKRLRNKEIAFVKVLWRNHLVEGATWEAKADMKSRYPHIFPSTPIQA